VLVNDIHAGASYAIGTRKDLAGRRTDLRQARVVSVRSHDKCEHGTFMRSRNGHYHRVEVYIPELKTWTTRFVSSVRLILPWDVYQECIDKWLGLPRTEVDFDACGLCDGAGVRYRDATSTMLDILSASGQGRPKAGILIDACTCVKSDGDRYVREAMLAMREGLSSKRKTILHLEL
jgi:hypothetical protein